MPWKATSPVDLRVQFISRLKAGERMSDLCRDFGISRRTGHKLKNRYEQLGAAALIDQRRAPKTIPHRTSPELEELVVSERLRHPTWGPKKLKDVLEQRTGRRLPSASTMGDILQRAGLIEARKKRERRPALGGSTLTQPAEPNDVWATDYKGHFRLGDRSYCYPLTTTDLFSRYLLCCEGMPAISDSEARDSFRLIFEQHGVPCAIRSDNGVPFASSGLAGLTMLSAYFVRLGIRLERIRPGDPQENGQHERMHRTSSKKRRACASDASATAGALRRVRREVQHRTPARSARDEASRRGLSALETLPRGSDAAADVPDA